MDCISGQRLDPGVACEEGKKEKYVTAKRSEKLADPRNTVYDGSMTGYRKKTKGETAKDT